ncbi:uncharacterized protein EV420DRAFT_60223 [Desarmillaria tabescens]|uniref:Galactose oxidase n=1 Tax=Armillaria tabescens TaxID=1929756 RepID=A0AA39NQ10_ARMTA|nr:uncharacterized protein EV420DRAFT_60223 [Desarmillaria tabescens]KAK0469742.1 hypothetical protein EV420DRAFT_60223 [Desarmillaria tabescens]
MKSNLDFRLVLPSVCILSLLLEYEVAAYTALPRWGQAVAVLNDCLFVHGGKTDEYNSYSYTQAPTNNDLLYLSLSSSFNLTSPPWELISSSSDTLTSQGPAVAWHTLSGLNSSSMLLFGGAPATNSATVSTNRADSSWMLDVYVRSAPEWEQEALAWAGQPTRRIHHSTVTSISGQVYIIGGERADGSGVALTDHYVFDPDSESFTQLPSTDGPSDITGHSSVILSNGTILVFGGYSQSQDSLLLFSTLWTLDTTQSTLSWNLISLSTTILPNPRRAFASTCIDGNKVVIQGGSDASYQTTYSDGWILDLSQDSLNWVEVDALTQVGARRDHFAVPIGSSVMFGFGYGSFGPFATNIIIYDSSTGSFASNFSPSSSSGTTQTMPGSSQTSDPHPTGTGTSPSSGGSVSADPSATNPDPGPSDPTGGGGGSGGTPADGGHGADSDRTTAIALGTTFGVLGLIVGCVILVYYVRRRKGYSLTGRRFMVLHDDTEDGEDSPQHDRNLPLAGGFGERTPHSNDAGWTILRSIGLGGVMPASMSTRHNPERRDMLADEDTQDFAFWHEKRWREGTGSSWSLRSILGGGRRRSQEPSAASSLGAPWKEKYDPFSDDKALMGDAEPELTSAGPSRPIARRQMSNGSTITNTSFVDPFANSIHEEQERYHDVDSVEDNLEMPPPARFKLPALSIQTVLPVTTVSHALSPVTETSRLSINDPSTPSIHTNSNSHEYNLSPFDSTSGVTSRTSYDPSRSPGQRTSTIIASVPTQPMRRSDSWWARFSRTSLLDRRNSDSSKRASLDFRDPNPPPRLVAIEESTHSATSASPEADNNSTGFNRSSSLHPGSRRVSKVYGAHGKSSSSLRTADSELIERMVGTMDVAQRVRTASHQTRESTGTSHSVEIPASEDGYLMEYLGDDHSIVTSPSGILSLDIAHGPSDTPSRSLTPPLGQMSLIPASSSIVSPESEGVKRPLRGESVAARVQAYERRMSHDAELPGINLKEERGRRSQVVDYGLVPRPSLYVANPDHRITSSGDS